MSIKLERNLMKGKITDLTNDEINIIKDEFEKRKDFGEYFETHDIFHVSTMGCTYNTEETDYGAKITFDKKLTDILRDGLLDYFEDDPEYDQLVNNQDMLDQRIYDVFYRKLICLEINSNVDSLFFYFTNYDDHIYQPISFFSIYTYGERHYYLDPIGVSNDQLIIHGCTDINDLIYTAISDSLPETDYSNATNVTLNTEVTFNSGTYYYDVAKKCFKTLLGSSYAEESDSSETITYDICLNVAIDLNDFIDSNKKLEITSDGLQNVLFKKQNCIMTSAYITDGNNTYSGLVMLIQKNHGGSISICPPEPYLSVFYNEENLICIPSHQKFYLQSYSLSYPK